MSCSAWPSSPRLPGKGRQTPYLREGKEIKHPPPESDCFKVMPSQAHRLHSGAALQGSWAESGGTSAVVAVSGDQDFMCGI